MKTYLKPLIFYALWLLIVWSFIALWKNETNISNWQENIRFNFSYWGILSGAVASIFYVVIEKINKL